MSSTPLRDSEAERQAIEWLERLDNACLPRSELEAFRNWLHSSESNERAYDDVKTIWGEIPAAAAQVYDEHETTQSARRVQRRNYVRRAVLLTGAVGACVALLFTPLPDLGVRGEEIETAALELRSIDLDDGSHVELSPLARATVLLSAHERRIELFTGVAYFDVSADDPRPFVVSTPFGDVRVRGTAFVVRIGEAGANVVVLSGAVEAAPKRAANLWTTLTSREDLVHVNADAEVHLAGGLAQVDRLDTRAREQRTAWRDQRIALENVSLREAANEATRFSGVAFDILDERLAQERVSLFVEGGDVEGFLRLLQSNLGVSVERRSDNLIVLRRANQHPAPA